MIFVENAGGLGNQLFIWTAAHKLNREMCTTVVILSPKKSDRKNELKELSSNCTHDIRVLETDIYFRVIRMIERLERKIFRAKPLTKLLRIITMKDPDSKIESGSMKAWFLRGYFQYIELIEECEIYVLPELEKTIEKKFESISQRIELPTQYQLFHVRRGDYLQNRETLGVLTDGYFRGLRDENLSLVICTETQSDLSDHFNASLILDNDSSSAWEALSVMAMSSSLVTSNSTLSWWGGILALRKNVPAKVICPAPWNKSTNASDNYLKIRSFTYRTAEFI